MEVPAKTDCQISSTLKASTENVHGDRHIFQSCQYYGLVGVLRCQRNA